MSVHMYVCYCNLICYYSSTILQVYDDLDSYHVADMVEFVGILLKDPSLAQHDHDEENGRGEISALCGALSDDTVAERRAHNPPPSLVPRLHTIVAHKMAHSNPLLSKDLKDSISLSGKFMFVLVILDTINTCLITDTLWSTAECYALCTYCIYSTLHF